MSDEFESQAAISLGIMGCVRYAAARAWGCPAWQEEGLKAEAGPQGHRVLSACESRRPNPHGLCSKVDHQCPAFSQFLHILDDSFERQHKTEMGGDEIPIRPCLCVCVCVCACVCMYAPACMLTCVDCINRLIVAVSLSATPRLVVCSLIHTQRGKYWLSYWF